ncbi:MAG: MlaE family ABC transporter permease [Planctomycetota bacterium]
MDRLLLGILPLLAIVLFFVGMILALQLATILGLLGVVEYVADIVGISMVREMAPLLTGIVLSGYAGAAIAAELGSMRVSEEFAAMDALALHPTRYLVAPRILAAAVSGPLITTIAMFVGIAGGLLVAVALLGMSPGQYLARTFSAVSMSDVALGLLKGGVFACVVASIACFSGARTEGGALGVGRATTAAVVKSIVGIIACDLFLTVLFFHLE